MLSSIVTSADECRDWFSKDGLKEFIEQTNMILSKDTREFSSRGGFKDIELAQ